MRRKGACAECVFWERVAERDYWQDEGVCRRRAPTAVPSSAIADDGEAKDGHYGLLAAWPRTFAETDWCGEFVCRDDVAGRDKTVPLDKPQAEAPK